MNTEQAAKYLNVSIATLRRRLRDNVFPKGIVAKVSTRRRRFDPERLKQWVENGGIAGDGKATGKVGAGKRKDRERAGRR